MYKTYGKFMKFFKPDNKGEKTRYPNIQITYHRGDKSIEKIIHGELEENKDKINKFISYITVLTEKQPKQPYFLSVLFYEKEGVKKEIYKYGTKPRF